MARRRLSYLDIAYGVISFGPLIYRQVNNLLNRSLNQEKNRLRNNILLLQSRMSDLEEEIRRQNREILYNSHRNIYEYYIGIEIDNNINLNTCREINDEFQVVFEELEGFTSL